MDRIEETLDQKEPLLEAGSFDETPRLAPHPFNKPSADTVLRSSDNVDFRVRRAILIEASPFFEDMFSLPQPQAHIDASQIEPIPVAESSRVLGILLRLCYPLEDRTPDDLRLEDVHAVLEAAMKYDVPAAIKPMRRALLDCAQHDPLRVFAIACILRLDLEARRAAEKAVEQGVAFGHYAKEFEALPAGCYHRLLQFRATATQTACADAFDFISPVDTRPPPLGDEPYVSEFESSQSQKLRDAGPPFDQPDADVVIITQDQVRFRVHSAILKMVSPVLAKMLIDQKLHVAQTSELNSTETADAPYHLQLPESSVVLEQLLSLHLYHPLTIDVPLDDYALLRAVTSSAIKYSMEGAVQIIKRHVTSLETPRAYILAVLYGWSDEAEMLARQTLTMNAEELQSFYDPALEQISSDAYFRLLHYHDKCGKDASAATEAYEWPKIASGSYCYNCRWDMSLSFYTAFGSYRTKMNAQLTKRPHVKSVLTEPAFYREFIQTMIQQERHGCRPCRSKLETVLEDVAGEFKTFKTAIDENIAQVQFSLIG